MHSVFALKHLKQERSAEHTNGGHGRAGHGGGHGSSALAGAGLAGGGTAVAVLSHGCNLDTVAGAGLHAGAGTGGHGGSDDRAGSGASLAARPSGPRRLSAPRTISPAAPSALGACAAAPPACPGTGGPGAGTLGCPWAPAVARSAVAERSDTVTAVPATGSTSTRAAGLVAVWATPGAERRGCAGCLGLPAGEGGGVVGVGGPCCGPCGAACEGIC